MKNNTMLQLVQVVIVAGLLMTPFITYCQGEELISRMTPKPVPTSPNVAALGKYGDYQVSHFTGIPDISIPIFEAKSGALSVPITLNYHASGIKPTDIASWVGMGWSISAGGQISRQVNGKRDEEYYLDHPLDPAPDVCTDLEYLRGAAAGYYDTEPDVFSYSYPGRSGKFLLPNGGTYTSPSGTSVNGGAFLVPYAPIVVKRYNELKYYITDENGVLYRFGTNYNATTSTEYTSSLNGATTAWHLMDIKAPNSADSINFKYQNVGVANRHDISYTYLVYDQCDAQNGGSCPGAQHLVPKKSDHDSDVNQEAPEEIIFETGRIKFVLNNLIKRSDAINLKSLDRIEIYSNASPTTPVKIIQFFYSYFKNADNGNAALKLDAVHFLDNSSLPVQKYKFTYFTNSFSWKPSLPNFLNARDLWGFYNGATQNTDLLLPQTIGYQTTNTSPPGNITIGGASNRNVDSTYSRQGVLSRIDFPTGGYTAFSYESNRYLKNIGGGTTAVALAGGLRVTKITSTEGPSGIPVVKTYKYGNSGVGTELFMSNFFNYSAAQLFSSDCHVTSPMVNYQVRTYHSYASYVTDSSSPVVYSKVTEYLGTSTGANNGRIVYLYDFGGSDVNHVLPASTKYYTNSFAWRRGKLLGKKVYDNAGYKLSEQAIQYTTYKEEGRLVGIGSYLFIAGNNACLGSSCLYAGIEYVNPQTYKTATYTQNSGVKLESKVTNYIYQRGDSTKFVATSVDKFYDPNKLQIVKAISTSSNSTEESVTINTYPFQLTAVNVNSTGAARGIYMLNDKNILTSPVETYSYLQKPNNTNRRIVSGQVTTFRQSPTNVKYVVPDQIYVWESAARVSSYTPVIINGTNNGVTFNANQKPRITSMDYDQYGNIQTVSKTNDVAVSYKWGYGNSLPIAEITNTLPKNVFYTSFEDEIAGFSFGGKTGSKSSANAVYSKSLSGFDPGEYILAYYKFISPNWVYSETAVTVPANGLYTISLTSGQYDEIRFYPKTAQIKTYTYDQLLGMKTMTDANGVATYYDYDSFGRLKLIRDNNNHILKTYEYLYKIMN